MTSKIISGTYASGYLVSSAFSAVTITSSGSVGGTGLTSLADMTVYNSGRLSALNGSEGLHMESSGRLSNLSGGVIVGGNARPDTGSYGTGFAGGAGVVGATGAYVDNESHIFGGNGAAGALNGRGGGKYPAGGTGGVGGAGVQLQSTGVVLNQDNIVGGVGGEGGACNYSYKSEYGVYGGVGGAGGAGVVLGAGASLVNASGEIVGGKGGTGGYCVPDHAYSGANGAGGVGGAGVSMTDGGYLYVTGGLIKGGTGGAGGSQPGKFDKYQYKPQGFQGLGGVGVYVKSGGKVSISAGATIEGGAGFYFPDSVTGDIAIELMAGGEVVNGGSVLGSVVLRNGGTVNNDMYISNGVSIGVDGTILNTGAIRGHVVGSFYKSVQGSGGSETAYFAGVGLGSGGILINGGANDTGASIVFSNSTQVGLSYNYGVSASVAGGSTVINYGTISGPTAAVAFREAADTLIAEAGCVFDGALVGGGGTLELVAGGGTITGLGGTGTVTGTTVATISGFGAYDLGSGAWTITGSDTLATGGGLTAIGAVALSAATFTNNGVITGLTADGVDISAATTLTNLGSIIGQGQGAGFYGVLGAGGVLVNGSATDSAALISGYGGVTLGSGATLTNYGTIVASGDGGAVNLSSASDVLVVEAGAAFVGGVYGGRGSLEFASGSGTISGGIATDGSATLQETVGPATTTFQYFGTLALGSDAQLYVTGAFTNSSVIAQNGVLTASGAAATLSNHGTIVSDMGNGVDVSGGRLVNGATNLTTALIQGYDGVRLYAGAVVTNFGTIQGAGVGSNGVGAYVSGSGVRLTNGAAGHAGATIEAYYVGIGAVEATSLVVTNFGTIAASGAGVDAYAMAVDFGAASDTLVVEAGCAFLGGINGGGGVLELASGTGTIANAFAGGALKVSGLLAATTPFDNFGEALIAAPVTITLNGASGSIAAGQSLIDKGTLDIVGALGGAGSLVLEGGATTFGSGAKLAIAHTTMAGTKTVVDVATDLAYAGIWKQTAGALSVAAGDKLTFSGKGDSFNGTLAGAGTVAFSGGSDAFSGLTLSAKSQTVSNATITLSGVIDLATTLAATTPYLVIAAAGASLTGGGELLLGDKATNAITGASATARLTNVADRILGAGLLGHGKMVLVNDAAGIIEADDTLALVIDTGAERVSNAGLIESDGTGGLTLDSAVSNTGTLAAAKGTLTAKGAVSGPGTVLIEGGTADFESSFAENVTFTAAGGTLELAKSQTYTGTINGLAKSSVTSLDLLDIAFGAKTKATYSGTATSGVLTVTDGTHTAKIKLAGNYTTSAFTVSSDGHGGTTVIDPPATGQAHAFIAAMAGFGPGGAGQGALAASPWPPTAQFQTPLIKP